MDINGNTKITRDYLQNIVVENKNKKIIVLEWCTGLGKTRAAIKLQESLTPNNTFLLVNEIAHKQNWEEEYQELGTSLKKTNTLVECYASLKNYENTEWDLIILDEAHHISEARLEVLKTIKVKTIIVLSATLESDLKYKLICETFGDYRGTNDLYHSAVPLHKAIEYKILPEPDIYLIPLELDKINRTETIQESRGEAAKRVKVRCTYEDMWKYKKDKQNYPNMTLTIVCTPFQKNMYYDNQISYYKDLYMTNQSPHIYNKWMRLGNERKKFLGELKTNSVHILLRHLHKKRLICFCTSIEQADTLGAKQAIHSKNKNNKEILDLFQKKKIDSLFCIGMLTEGQNLKDIDAGIIIQLDGKERPFTQKHGEVSPLHL